LLFVFVFLFAKQPYSVRFAPSRPISAADAYPELVRDIGEFSSSRLRQLFETASARRRRHIYAEAMKRGVDRLAWQDLVTSSTVCPTDDQRLTSDVACPSPAFYHKVRFFYVSCWIWLK